MSSQQFQSVMDTATAMTNASTSDMQPSQQPSTTLPSRAQTAVNADGQGPSSMTLFDVIEAELDNIEPPNKKNKPNEKGKGKKKGRPRKEMANQGDNEQ